MDPVPSPLNSREPASGKFTKLTVTSAVKKSSVMLPGVSLLLHSDKLEVLISVIAQAEVSHS